MKSFYAINFLLLIVMIASMIALLMQSPLSIVSTQSPSPPKVKYFSTDLQSSPRPSLVSIPKHYEKAHSHSINITIPEPFSPPVYESFAVNPMPPIPVPYIPPPSYRPNPPPSLTPSRSTQKILIDEMYKPYLHNTDDYTRG